MKRSLAAVLSALILFVITFSPVNAHAQISARIKGSVTDPGGAALPKVPVTATNEATGVKYTTVSSASGDYIFQSLPVGTYTISATADGFKTFSATGILLTIDQEYVEKVAMTVGAASDTVSIMADAVQVNTTEMQLNNIVDSTEMVELPLIDRSFTSLELINPGVQASSDRFGSYSVSGAQTQQSEYLVNGADTNDIALNTVAVTPSLDAIAEFNLIEGSLNAEYDRNSGGIVTATIKNGTNKFHGNAFDFYRDTFLNLNNFFQKTYSGGVRTDKVAPYHQNIFGGTIGGPVLKDKLFFFGSYQGIHSRTPATTNAGIYNTSELGGNFNYDTASLTTRPCSPALNATTGCNDTNGYLTANVIPSTISVPGCTTAGETWAQCAYDNKGLFPAAGFNKISSALIAKYIPASDINSGTNNYATDGANTNTTNQYIGRVDYSLNTKNAFTAVGLWNRSTSFSVLPFTGASVPGFGENDILTVNQYTFDYVRQISASAVNDFAIHWTRFNYQAVTPVNVVTPSSLGFNINPQDAAAASVPYIAVSGNNGIGFALGFSTNGPQPRIDQVYQIDDNFSKSYGHHQLKFGYDGRRFNTSNPFGANNSGAYSFDTNAQYGTGDPAIDFLFGVPDTYAQGSGAVIQADAFLNYVYAQDSWKLTKNLTLDYGLGYSIDTPLQNHQYGGEAIACLIPGQQSKIFSNAPVGLVYPGDSGCTNTGQAKTRHSEFGPRFGFVWAPDLGIISGSPGKFSIGGGFGIYYNRTEEETALQTLETPPFGTSSSGATDVGGSPQFANPFADITGNAALSEANKFPFVFPKAGQAANPADYGPYYYISTYGPSFRAPYAQNFQLSLEREFPSKIVARVSYVGSLARHNQVTYEGNYETAAGHAACAAGNEVSPVLGGTANCASNRNYQNLYWPQNTVAGSVYAPTGYPGFTNIGEVGSFGSSSYNALQVKVTKSASRGLFLQVSYTYSHALDNGSNFENSGFGESGSRGYNQYQQNLNYGDSAYDARQRLVITPIYISPLLKGNWYTPKNLALSGWEISGIVTFATGFPFDISYAGASSDSLYCAYYGSFYACPDVPNQISSLKVSPNRAGRLTNGNVQSISRASFSNEAIGTFGNLHRDPYHGPGLNNTNMVLAKNFNLSNDGVMRLQLRMESDNVFNHTQFANPGTTWNDTIPNANYTGTFGQIGSAAAARLTVLGAKIYF